MPYVTDTHALVWHMTSDRRLSKNAREIFEKADRHEERIVIPCIVFFEILYLTEKKKLIARFDEFVSLVRPSTNYVVESLSLPIVERCREIPRAQVRDPWDRLIAATSLHLGLPLLTRDAKLAKTGMKTVW
ncbi:MAG: type II toxin-antitoxin system VapC family toxin [Chloroflexota bacterium]